jgi:hypothetical protein
MSILMNEHALLYRNNIFYFGESSRRPCLHEKGAKSVLILVFECPDPCLGTDGCTRGGHRLGIA